MRPKPTTPTLFVSRRSSVAATSRIDFTPAHTIGRFAAVAEGLMGQLYLVTVLALIVSNLGRERNPIDVEAPSGGDEPPDAPA